MNKRVLSLVLLLAVVVSTTVTAEDSYVGIPVNISLVPVISLGQPAGYKTVNNVQLNVVAGYADVLKGAALGVVSIIGEDAVGVQAAQGRQARGPLRGGGAVPLPADRLSPGRGSGWRIEPRRPI